MASAEHPLLKQCRIKTGVVVRTRKELDRYKEEMDSQRSKIEAMRAEGRDEFDVRQQQQVFNETERVIPDTIRRLQKAVDDLTEFLVRAHYYPAGTAVQGVYHAITYPCYRRTSIAAPLNSWARRF